MRRALLTVLVLLGLVLPFAGKPVHLDDANFLTLARGAAADPWRPHDVLVNWQGTTERAFDVLSNPPGIAWWLAPVAEAPVMVQHLAMLPWLILAIFGAWRLGDRLAGAPAAAALLVCASPMGLLAAHSLMPDLPLLACTLAGAAGLVSGSARRTWPWALLLGCAVLFRYSGLALLPLAVLWGVLQRDVRGALFAGAAAALPFALLCLHDLSAYGEVHFVAMLGFQGVSDSGRDVARKLIAAVAMLGGAGLLPVLCWRRPVAAGVGLLVGAGLGLAGAMMSGHTGLALVTTVLAAAGGGAAIAGAAWTGSRASGSQRESPDRETPDRQSPERETPWPSRETLWLLAWGVGGLVFLLKLRFTAARYWLPFLAPWVLLALRGAPPRWIQGAVGLTVALSLLLARADLGLARAQEMLARQVVEKSQEEVGLFAGHWGWQHHLEAAGWAALEDDGAVPLGTLLAISQVSWPQEAAPGCFEMVAAFQAPAAWGPRVHTADGAANVHAFLVSGSPPIETYAPWGYGGDPLDQVQLMRACAAP